MFGHNIHNTHAYTHTHAAYNLAFLATSIDYERVDGLCEFMSLSVHILGGRQGVYFISVTLDKYLC
jgi:hypothetical protein